MPKKTQMTDRIYAYLREVIPRQGYAPSVREICEAVGLKSPSTARSTSTSSGSRSGGSSRRGTARAEPSSSPVPRTGTTRPEGTKSPFWATWPPARPFWPRSASTTI